MNPKQVIEIFDMPRRLRAGFLSLVKEGKDPSIANGNIITEVGEPVRIGLPSYCEPFLAYELRAKRKVRIPQHVFGKMRLGNTYSAFLPRVISVPTIGTAILLQPRVTPEQSTLIQMYKYINAHVCWIIHVPAPLGVGLLLEVYAPEIDLTTKTRGVRFRPSGVNTIAVVCPWSNDLSVVDRTTGRIGQSGGAISIRTVEDNTVETVNTPLNITVYQTVFDVNCTQKIPSDKEFESIVGLNFIDATQKEKSEFVTEHGDEEGVSTEVNAEGAADLPDQMKIDETPASVLAVPVEQPVGKPTPPVGKRSTKSQQGAVGARWFEATPITLNSDSLETWVNYSINPYLLTQRGDNISLAYRRNVWVTGSMVAGYVRIVKVKFVIARSPQVSGVVEVQDSRNDSSRYLVEFGGNVELDLIPKYFSGASEQARPRYYNNHWLRTNEAMCDSRFRLTGFNRTSDIADVKVRILARSGNALFDVPTKPRPSGTNVLQWLVEKLYDYTEQKDLQILNDESIDFVTEHGDDEGENTFNSEQFVTPFAAEEAYIGEVNPGGAFDEDIDQDDFAVQVWSGNLPTDGNIAVVPMNLSVIPDESGTGGLSTIAQKFERNAHVIPTQAGNMGPQIGTYTVELRLPTTISGQISHVSLPGDMVDETVAFAFGLGDILSLATSALQAVGGPTISAGITAARGIFNMIKGIGGSKPDKSDSDSANMPMLTGPLDVSRFINFLKPIAQNELADPTFGQILLQARDFIGANGEAIESIPARIWARMNNSKIERTLFDRTLVPENTLVNEVYLPYDRISYIVDRFGSHPKTFIPGTFQNQCWKKFITVFRKEGLKPEVRSLSLKEILAYEVTTKDEESLNNLLLTKTLTFLP